MKKDVILLLMILLLPFALSVDLSVEKQSSNEVMILGTNEPAIFDLKITNNGETDNFIIYTFFGSGYSPKEKFSISKDTSKNIPFKVFPPYDLSRTGSTAFDYYIKGADAPEYTGRLNVQIIELKDAFETGSVEINPEDNSIEIYLKNKVNYNFENLDVKFSSAFFDFERIFSLAPKETKTFQLTLDKEDIKELKAGFYTLTAEVKALNKTANVVGAIKFAEKGIINSEIEEYGFIIRTKIITKANDGNTAEPAEITVNKNILSRLFTSFNIQPDETNREGSKIIYSWNRELQPGEELKVKVKTNWLLPLIFIILVIAIVIFVKKYTQTDLQLKKKITFVKSKGGEFALKVSVFAYAKKQLDNVLIIERVPLILKIYNKFGKENPVRIDEKNKKIEWEFKRLEAGEKRVITYIIYSKVGVLGKFALPRTASIYESSGKINEAQSNKVFFITEQKKDEI